MTNIFRMKRKEKDNAKRAQSREWYSPCLDDWIESDEIEDKMEGEEKEEEEIKYTREPGLPPLPTPPPALLSPLAQSPTKNEVPLGDGRMKVRCPVCREDFDQFYKQVHSLNNRIILIILIDDSGRRRCGGGGLVSPQCHDS